MNRIPRTALLALPLLLVPWSAPCAQEHSFGLRVGTLQYPEEGILTDRIVLDRRPTVIINYRREFESSDLDGTFIEGSYEWRRDTDAHLSLALSGGVYSQSAVQTVPGTALVNDARGSGGQWLVGVEPNTSFRNLNTLDYTIYYFHLSPRWNFTTGKVRFWLGAGVGLWANLWREVVDTHYTDVFSCERIEPGLGASPYLQNCTSEIHYRESDGNRRSSLPFSGSAGLTYQFLAHWSLNVEDRYIFNTKGTINLFRIDSETSIDGNQIILGFAYKL
jgi:opacity protein-like surface antigen